MHCALLTAGLLLNIWVEIMFLWLTLKINCMKLLFILFWHYKNGEVKYKIKIFTQFSIQIPKTISQFYVHYVQKCEKTLKGHVIWLDLDSGSCRQPEVTSAVIQKTATRRSKQTRQQEQHKHKHGSTDRVPPTGWVRECRTEQEEAGGAFLEMLPTLEPPHSHPEWVLTFVSTLPTCRSHTCPTAPKILGSSCL